MSGILMASSVSIKFEVVPPGTPDWTPWTYATGFGQRIVSLPNSALYDNNYVTTWDEWDGGGKSTLVVGLPQQSVIDGDYLSGWTYWDGKASSTLIVPLPTSATLNT